VKRRNFIFVLGAALTLPTGARSEQQVLPVVGYLSNGSPVSFAPLVAAFRSGLGEMGYFEGQNVVLEYRWAEGKTDRLPGLAADLIKRRVAVIAATGGNAPAIAAKAATANIPIVFTGGGDPVKLGLAASLGRPGGNATGVVNFGTDLTKKRLALLHDLVPTASLMVVLVNPRNQSAKAQVSELEEAARAIGQKIMVLNASDETELAAVFENIKKMRAGAVLVAPDPLFMRQRVRLVALAAKYALPASYPFRDFVVAGGLMSYGVNLPDIYRQAGVYVGRILKGARPADLPILQPTKFDVVLNSKTANALRISIPSKLLLIAEIIE